MAIKRLQSVSFKQAVSQQPARQDEDWHGLHEWEAWHHNILCEDHSILCKYRTWEKPQQSLSTSSLIKLCPINSWRMTICGLNSNPHVRMQVGFAKSILLDEGRLFFIIQSSNNQMGFIYWWYITGRDIYCYYTQVTRVSQWCLCGPPWSCDIFLRVMTKKCEKYFSIVTILGEEWEKNK